jgi:hypothetical protein
MALDIDGFAVLSLIGKHPSVFSDIQFDISKQARVLAGKQIKLIGNLHKLHEIYRILGPENFNLIVDGLEVSTLLKRLDRSNPDIKAGDARWQRQRLIALANGSSDPTPLVEKRQSTKKNRSVKRVGHMATGARALPEKASQTISVEMTKDALPNEPEVIDYSSVGAKRER